jgi:sodium-dependent dicarboxylate transporter 2/3/5
MLLIKIFIEIEKMNKEKQLVEEKEKILSRRNIFFIILAFSIVIIFYFIPTPEGLSQSGQIMIGILFMAAVLWITEPIPLPVTGLLIIILQPMLGVMESKDVFSAFGNQAVFFLIGAFIIAAAVEKQGLHKRFALRFLGLFEQNPKLFTLGIMLSCAILSFIMPEHGVAALFLPIIVSILIAMKVIPRQSNFGKVSMLCIAYGCSIGSLGTLIGGARNPLTVGYLSSLENPITVTFFDWMTYAMPVVFISLPLVWLILQLSFPIEIKDVSLAKKEIDNQVMKMGIICRKDLLTLLSFILIIIFLLPFSNVLLIMLSGIILSFLTTFFFDKKEFSVFFILYFVIILWVFFSHNLYFGLAVIAILGAVLLFITGSINWKDVEKRVPWGIILLYGGAITLGIGIQNTGAGAWIASKLFKIPVPNIFIIILIMIVFTVLLTNIMSNIGAVALLLPIGIAIASNVEGISPLLASMIIALSGGLAFILVIATPGNAITYSSGYFSTKDLFKAGILANIICIIIVFLVAVIYWIGILHLDMTGI